LFQLAQASHVANLQLAVSLAPGVYRLLAYCVALRNLRLAVQGVCCEPVSGISLKRGNLQGIQARKSREAFAFCA